MKHVSFSQLMTYIRCSEHWLFRYKLGLKNSPRKVLKHGFALHETFAYHFEQKKRDGEGVDPTEAKEFFADVFASALQDYAGELEAAQKDLTKEYLAKEKKVSVKELVDTGVAGIDLFFKKLNPKIKPDLVEEAFSFPVQKGMELVGRIDLTDKNDVIHELKTTRKVPNVQDIKTDAQLALYQIGYHTITKKYPKGISKDYLVLSKKGPRLVQFKVSRPFVDRKTVLANIVSVMEAAQRNIFYCLHPAESWVCAKEWCGYYKHHQELKRIGLQNFISKYKKR